MKATVENIQVSTVLGPPRVEELKRTFEQHPGWNLQSLARGIMVGLPAGSRIVGFKTAEAARKAIEGFIHDLYEDWVKEQNGQAVVHLPGREAPPSTLDERIEECNSFRARLESWTQREVFGDRRVVELAADLYDHSKFVVDLYNGGHAVIRLGFDLPGSPHPSVPQP